VTADDSVAVPDGVAELALRYRRLERPVSGAVALLVGVVGVVSLALLPLPRGVLVVAVLVVAVRAPVVRRRGRLVLATEMPPDAVAVDLGSATPPVLPFRWGVADTVRRTPDGGRYEFSYLFGLGSVTMETAFRRRENGGELVVTAADRPWATYDVTTRREDGRTVVDVELTSDRRFGLRRLPEWLVAERYLAAALETQGYTVLERERSVGP